MQNKWLSKNFVENFLKISFTKHSVVIALECLTGTSVHQDFVFRRHSRLLTVFLPPQSPYNEHDLNMSIEWSVQNSGRFFPTEEMP